MKVREDRAKVSAGSGVEYFWGDLAEHPQCPHGPTLLFGKAVDGDLRQYYACSACRDRKTCNFYLEKDQKLTKVQKATWQQASKKFSQQYNHRKCFLRLNEILSERPENRGYCHTCERLFFAINEGDKHQQHETVVGLTDEQLRQPSKILKPLSNPKKEAQYMFSEKATAEITDLLLKAGAKHVLCIGAPRIHEYITENFEGKLTSLLLDFDGRYHSFLGPLSFCWYNLFNHHFFSEEAEDVFRDFLTQDGGKGVFVVCDPPFGGRVEPMSHSIRSISESHGTWNGLKDDSLKVLFVFPYFMESIMQRKSNPPGVAGGLRDLKMSDYKVDYDNHPLFVTGSGGRKYGSPVRIFTNVSLNLLELPGNEYKYCKRCDKWVSIENKHCKVCKSCTSKDGRRYRHCKICVRCVKPTWKHCKTCQRCVLERHTCGTGPKVTGRCFKCDGTDHTEGHCPVGSRKRKSDDNNGIRKRKKMEDPKTNGVKETKKLKTNTDVSTRKGAKSKIGKNLKVKEPKLKFSAKNVK